MGFMDFLEQKVLTVPQGKWILIPHWLLSCVTQKNNQPERLCESSLPVLNVLNRRHCGQSQHSAVLGQRERKAESKKLGVARKQKARPKRKKAKPEPKEYCFKRNK